jgi:hypothetical protein
MARLAATREFWCGLRIWKNKETYTTKSENSETSDPPRERDSTPGGFGEAASASHRDVTSLNKESRPHRS